MIDALIGVAGIFVLAVIGYIFDQGRKSERMDQFEQRMEENKGIAKKDSDSIGGIARGVKADQQRQYRRIIAFIQREHLTKELREDEIAKLIREDRID